MATPEKKVAKIVAQPDCRGGATPEVVRSGAVPGHGKLRIAGGQSGSGSVHRLLDGMQDDQNLIYLAARLRSYAEQTEGRLRCLRDAVAEHNAAAIAELAQALTDVTSRLGAIRMMKLCIALQMLGRRGLIDKAQDLLGELESEYSRFKSTLHDIAV